MQRIKNNFLPPKPFSPEIEAHFLRYYSERFVTQRRAAAIIGLIMCLIYFAIDTLNAINNPEFEKIFVDLILVPRLLGNLGLAITAWFSLRPIMHQDEHYASRCVISAISSSYFMLLALTYAQPFPEHYLCYFDGMVIDLFFLFGLARMLVKPTMLLVLLLLSCSIFVLNADSSQAALALQNELSYKEHENPIAFLIIFSVIGYLMSLQQERAVRESFSREQHLKQAREATKRNAEELLLLKEHSRRQAEQQNQDKSKFIVNAAHDLRNIMQPVENFLAVSQIALSRGDIAKTQDYLNAATHANNALRATVNTLLDLSALESGLIKLEYRDFNVHALAQEVLHENAAFAQQQQVNLRLSRPKHQRYGVRSDYHQLKRILMNLVGNGIKYADPTKTSIQHVTLAIVGNRQTVRIDICDNGIGIPNTEIDNIFKPLYQLHNPERNRNKGVGLGLSIVQTTISQLQQHSLTVKSEVAAGTRFSLRLPRGNDPTLAASYRSPPDSYCIQGCYVLLIENDCLVKESLRLLLQENGADVDVATSWVELTNLLPTLERYPDIVITDYRLPDGYTAVDILKTLPDHLNNRPPCIILTGETALPFDLLDRAHILYKPVETPQLLQSIQQLLA